MGGLLIGVNSSNLMWRSFGLNRTLMAGCGSPQVYRLGLESDDVVFNLLVTANEECRSSWSAANLNLSPKTRSRKRVIAYSLATTDFWHAWVAKSAYRGRWRETVARSALVLKLLTSRKHGSIIAARRSDCLRAKAESETGTIDIHGSGMPPLRFMRL